MKSMVYEKHKFAFLHFMHTSSNSRYFGTFFQLLICVSPVDRAVPPRGSQRALPAAVESAPCRSTRKSSLQLKQGKFCLSQFPKCKSEDAGPWRRHGLEREWALPAAHYSTKMLIFTGFIRDLRTPLVDANLLVL